MKHNLETVAFAPTLLTAAKTQSYTVDEIEDQLDSEGLIKGVEKHDLPTPALLLDLDRLENNLAAMGRHAKEKSVALRPHAKTHKCAEIAQRQIAEGALGVCTATIYEAEQMAAAGIEGILITSELVGSNKITRLVRLTEKRPDTIVVVDSAEHAAQLSVAASMAKVEINVLIDIDPVGRRTGIVPGKAAVDLAKTVDRSNNLNLRGVHGYSGVSSHITGFNDRKEHSTKYMTPVIESFRQMQREGLPVEIMSGTSTGTYNIDPDLGMTELQVGSYVFMDVDYRLIGGQNGDLYEDFQPSLTVLATVISHNYEDRATVDSGFKSFATDRNFGPEVLGYQGVEYRFAGDEHGILMLGDSEPSIKLGDKLELIVPHCDPNVNLYDRMYCTRGDKVVDVWKVIGRGHG